MSHAVNDEALDKIFRTARTFHKWQDKPVSPALLMALYDLMRWGPTALNACPARILFVVSKDAKEKLKPHLSPGNVGQVAAAPVTAIVGYDLDFPATLAKLFPHHPGAAAMFADPVPTEALAFRNSSLQGGYFIVAARALGLDCGPMSGFDADGVTKAFFAGSKIKANFLCNLGYGDPEGLHPRDARLSFDDACKIV